MSSTLSTLRWSSDDRLRQYRLLVLRIPAHMHSIHACTNVTYMHSTPYGEGVSEVERCSVRMTRNRKSPANLASRYQGLSLSLRGLGINGRRVDRGQAGGVFIESVKRYASNTIPC